MAKLPAATRTAVVDTIAATEAEIVTHTAEATTAQTALDQANRRRGRAERQLEKLRSMLSWLDDVNSTNVTDAGGER